MSKVKVVDAKTAKEWLANKEAIIVDVREPAEYTAMHIAGATLIPLGTLTEAKLPKAGNKKIIIHCQLGKRGNTACEKLLESSPTLDVYNLEGGITAWHQEGFVVEQSAEEILSIDRQFQVVIGGGVLFGALTGYLIAPIFLIIAIIFGAALLYTGLTGSTEVIDLVKKMPWNESR